MATATAAIVVLTPANFYHFLRSKFNFQPLSFIFETLAKNLQKQKSLLRSMGRKSKQKNGKKAFKSVAMKRQQFLPKFVNNGKSRRFFDRCWGFAEMLWVKISSYCTAWIGLGPFKKKYKFYATLWRYFAGEFFWPKKFNKLPNWRRFRASQRFWNQFFWVISPSDIFKHILENYLTRVRPLETPKKPCLNSWQGSAQLSSPSPPPSEFCTDKDNSVIRSAMDALRYSKK